MNVEHLSKEEQRKYFLSKRNSISEEDIARKSKAVTELFFKSSIYDNLRTVMAYVSVRSEVRTHELIAGLIKDKGKAVIPKCDTYSKTLAAYLISDISELSEGAYGIPEPDEERIISGGIKAVRKSEIDAVIVPAAAFDVSGFRIGYGAGYYDRFLKDYGGVKIGFEFSDCICGRIAGESTDIAVDIIFSEQGCRIINDTYRL